MNLTGAERKVIEHFSTYISNHKKELISKVLDQRTRYITVVLENIYQSQNASAVIRTCECMGIQDVHIIEDTEQYDVNPLVLKGAHKWMTLNRYRDNQIQNVKTCFDKLRSQHFKIYVTDPSPDGIAVQDIDLTSGKVALVFGNELRGVSEYALAHADQKIRIPMYGFTESLNISVSVAICLNTIVEKLRKTSLSIGLTEQEKEVLLLKWYRQIVRRSDLIEREFLKTIV